MTIRRRALVRALPAAALAAAALTAAPGSASPVAHAAKTCASARYPGNGYFNALTVSHVSCAAGRKLEVAHYHCRLRHGGIKGKCSSVSGYQCTESKRQSNAIEFDARVTCKSTGSRRVVWVYQQNTH